MLKIAVVLLLLCSVAFANQKEHAKPQSSPASVQQPSTPASPDIQALRQDIARMKALVQQMQTNLAFVDTTQSALKHQFQLEIDMWQTLITEMERRLSAAPAR
jgi:hypothetical protein